jgi:LmbE family N-acetylglucosaminyl deacetylase
MKSLIIAPHPDDELLGCGGTLLRRLNNGGELAWLTMTKVEESYGWDKNFILEREGQISEVKKQLRIKDINHYALPFSAARLDTYPFSELVSNVARAIEHFQPEELFVPFWGDVHSDHRITFEIAMASSKWFRFPFIKRILAYETLSETELSPNILSPFLPNLFIDISAELESKLNLIKIYKSEIGEHPFPRSEIGVKTLAHFRGLQSGYTAAEAFQILREKN